MRFEEDARLPMLVLSAWASLIAPQVEALFGRAPALGSKAKAQDQLMPDTERLIIARSRTAEVLAREDRWARRKHNHPAAHMLCKRPAKV